jgi:hypothetical protein
MPTTRKAPATPVPSRTSKPAQVVELQIFRDLDSGGIWKIQAVRGDERETVTSWWNPEEADKHAARLAQLFGCAWRRIPDPSAVLSDLPDANDPDGGVE